MASTVRDYYALLGVSRGATAEEIKRAYRKLARELHPDVNPDPASQDRFKTLTSAYEVLSDPEKRRVVDLGGDPLASGGGQSNQGGNPFNGFGGFGDVFETFFGGAARGPRSRVRQGADALLRIELTLPEMAFGVKKDLAVETAVLCAPCHGGGCAPGTKPKTCETCGGRGEVQSVQRSMLGPVMSTRACPSCAGSGQRILSPCPSCAGEGRVRARRNIAVDVPGGIEDGMRIRMTGQGEVGTGGGPAGDLYIEVSERPHETFTRDGSDLHCAASVPMVAAALGTEVHLTTLDSEETVEIKPGTQSGAILTLRGKGVPRLRSTVRGDLHVHIDVRTPTKLDEQQLKLLRELAALRKEEVSVSGNKGKLFSKVRDAFGNR